LYNAKTKEKKGKTNETKRELLSQINSFNCIILKKIQKIRRKKIITGKLKIWWDIKFD